MNRNTKTTLLVAGLVLVGFILGIAAGSGDEPEKTAAAAETVTVVKTDTVTHTETVTRTRTRVKYRTRVKVKYKTVTEAAPQPVAADAGTDLDAGDGCSPEYQGACVPDGAGDVNCTDLSDTDFDSVGSDPYGLDRDGDGIACES
jgi:resuscitation-promoting factor RpfB